RSCCRIVSTMIITFLALGSTGDILPYATLARALQDAGYRPVFVTSEDYRPLLDRLGVPGRFIPGDAQAAIAEAGADARRLMLAFAELSRALPSILDPSAAWLKDSRAVVNQLPIGLYGFDLAQRLAIPHIQAAVIPLTPTADFPMMGWPAALSFLPGYNRWSFRIYQRLTWLAMSRTINRWRAERLKLPRISGSAYLARLRRQPLLYGYSPLAVPRPADWPANIHVTGYWFPEDQAWRPSDALVRFLQAGQAPLFIGFGSMPIQDPQSTMKMILEATAAGGLRAVVHAGWAGLGQDELPEHLYLLDYAPYSWLFPRVAAVIHHGGSGTTAAGLRAGMPGMITPFTFDQGFWGRRVAELGVGLQPIPFRKLTAAKLTEAIVRLTGDEVLKGRAADLGQRIQAEDGLTNAIQLLASYLRSVRKVN
ncbi:MAG: glycosyltransferase, partial [Candidatus Promineifilaceae bacterium]